MKTYLALGLLPLLFASALADVGTLPSPDTQKQPRTLGQKAVLHIYYYAPKTLEITYVDSYLFKDEDACKAAIGAALQIAMPHAGAGDLVSAQWAYDVAVARRRRVIERVPNDEMRHGENRIVLDEPIPYQRMVRHPRQGRALLSADSATATRSRT